MSKYEQLVQDINRVILFLKEADFDMSVADTGNYAAGVAAGMLEALLKKEDVK